jgi:transglutaminase-like putative cysteine protease
LAGSRAFVTLASVWVLTSIGLVLRAHAQAAKEETPSDWPPISPEELALKDDPANPGEPAIILYRDDSIDDVARIERHYTRVKIFTDEGKKNADIEIPYLEKAYEVEDIQARTIRPDGTAVVFQGQVFDRLVIKAKRLRFQAKAFTLPDVQKGGIIEYSYKVHWREKLPDVLRNPRNYLIRRALSYPTAHWRVQEDLFTRRARFSFRPLPGANPAWTWNGLPQDKQPERKPDGTVQLEIENVPAYETEDHMPPEEMVRARVDFFYTLDLFSPEGFWGDQGGLLGEELQKFIGDSKLVRHAAAELIAAHDSPEAKLRKIYARVQQVRYLSYEPSKTLKEEKRENIKEVKSAEDVLKRGYASGNQINLLFVALARASGFDSFPVMVADRRRYFFQQKVPDPRQLDAMVVWVKVGSSDAYFDPAARFCPFKLLPWFESGTRGVAVHERIGVLASTPEPKSAEAVTERTGTLELDREGSLKGKIQVNFVGQEALE